MSNSKNSRLPRYQRAKNPPSIRFNDRDRAILKAIYEFDGVLSRRQIHSLFWPNRSRQAMTRRLSKLYHNRYINWPNEEQRKLRPIPEPIVWLDWKGILHVASSFGSVISEPKKENENQFRKLQSQLRSNQIRWLREPNWSQLQHDLAVADFRINVIRNLSHTSNMQLERWIPESAFRADSDVIEFTHKARNGSLRKKRKGVRPDGFFEIRDLAREARGQPSRALFLLEIDMASHDNESFGIEKAAAGVAYIKSRDYRNRFGSNSGRWLVVTTGETRMNNLMKQVQNQAKAQSELFYFSTIELTNSNNPLTDESWFQVGSNQPLALPFG